MRITNLIVAASAASLVQALPSKREVKDIKKRTASGFTWVGVSESGAEFGSNIPGTLGTDYIWPETDKIAVLREAGMNIFRIPFLMERLTPDSLTGSFASTYLADLKSTVEYVTGTGAYAVLDPHNYGRYDGSIIESTSDFKTWWTNVATEFASNDLVIFDTNNEYHDMEESLVVELNQAAINGIRAAGATTQYIFVEGNAYTGAWSWTEYNDDMSALTDTEDKIIYEMHQYLDSDSSGTSETCVNSTIGQNRLESATEWLKTNGKLGFIGEFAGGVNSVCEEAVEGMLSYMSENSDVWTGAEWWSAGPWWGSYMYSLEPTTGAAYSTYLPILEKYFPANGTTASVAASGSASVAAATSTAAAIQETTTPNVLIADTTSTTSAQVETVAPATSAAVQTTLRKSKSAGPCKLGSATSSAVAVAATTPAAVPTSVVSVGAVSVPTSVASVPTSVASVPSVAPVAPIESTSAAIVVPTTAAAYATTPVYVPTAATSVSSVAASATAAGSAAASDPQGPEATTSAGLVKQYYQCGGINWTGPTECESPYTCKEQNVWYYQCVAE